MKRLAFSLLAMTVAMTAMGITKLPRKPMTEEERTKLMEVRQRQTGGFLEIKGKGYVAILNGGTEITEGTVREILKPLVDFTRGLNIEVRSVEPFVLEKAKSIREKAGAGACVFIADAPTLPMSLVALEEGWGMVNLAPLREGAPGVEKFAIRFRKELIRITSIVFSGAKSQYMVSPLQSVTSVADLDKTVGDQFGIDTMMGVVKHLPEIGVVPDQRITYREACRKGIAPAPTNDFQKAIWDKEHAVPKNPMKIEFDPKKGK